MTPQQHKYYIDNRTADYLTWGEPLQVARDLAASDFSHVIARDVAPCDAGTCGHTAHYLGTINGVEYSFPTEADRDDERKDEQHG